MSARARSLLRPSVATRSGIRAEIRVGLAGGERDVHGCHRSGGKADDADAVWHHAIFPCIRPDEADGLLRVGNGDRAPLAGCSRKFVERLSE